MKYVFLYEFLMLVAMLEKRLMVSKFKTLKIGQHSSGELPFDVFLINLNIFQVKHLAHLHHITGTPCILNSIHKCQTYMRINIDFR